MSYYIVFEVAISVILATPKANLELGYNVTILILSFPVQFFKRTSRWPRVYLEFELVWRKLFPIRFIDTGIANRLLFGYVGITF